MAVNLDVASGISQIFSVKDETGIFLSGINLFVASKDENIPLMLQIRTVENDSPGNVIIPFSEVVLDPDEIQLSNDGSIPTRFVFNSPVYLNGPNKQELKATTVEPEKKYCITITSPSKNYDFFIAKTGNTSLQSDSKVTDNFKNVGPLFQSQNSVDWIPRQDSALTFNILRCSFGTEGLVRMFNSNSSVNNGGKFVTDANYFRTLSKKIIVGLSSDVTDSNVVPGVTITQGTATSKLTGVGGTAITLGVLNVGTGYTAGTFTGVSLVTETGFGDGAVADIVINASGEVSSATITDGGSGYAVGDVLQLPDIGSDIGFGGKVSVESVGDTRLFELSDVQGQFSVGLGTVFYTNSVGTATSVGSGVTIASIREDQYFDGLHMQVYHPDHGMHSSENYTKIEFLRPPNEETNSVLDGRVSSTDTEITLESTDGFETFEGQTVDAINIGYAIIGREVIGYTGVTSTELTGVTRGIDGTFVEPLYDSGVYVYQYEFSGVSLRRINKVHNFADVDRTTHDRDLDSYHIKIDPSTSGKDRSTGTDKLYFAESKTLGEEGAVISQNLLYSTLTPNIKHKVFSSTNIVPRIRTFTASSIDGTENAFEDTGYVEFDLEQDISFSDPRGIFSTTNEENLNLETPGNRSLEMDFFMTSSDDRVSPYIDLQDASVSLNINRINQPVTDFANDDTVRSFYNDNHEAVYISKSINMQVPANSLKVYLTCGDNDSSDIRVLYQIIRPDVQALNWELFPGFSNYTLGQDGIRRVTDASKNDGSPDYEFQKETSTKLVDYEYTVDDLAEFTSFAIKIIMSGTNQARPPYLDNLRVIATAKPSL